MKRNLRKLPLILCAMSAVALGSVGFSAWVIAGENTVTQLGNNISVDVGELKDNVVNVVVQKQITETIRFDAEKNDVTAPITNPDPNPYENLAFTFELVAENAYVSDAGSTIQTAFKGLTLALSTIPKDVPGVTSSLRLSSALSENYIVSPFGTTKMNTEVLAGEGTKTISDKSTCIISRVPGTRNALFKFSCSFAWGTLFNGNNPSTWTSGTRAGWNAQDLPTIKEQIKNLEGLKKESYKLTIGLVA